MAQQKTGRAARNRHTKQAAGGPLTIHLAFRADKHPSAGGQGRRLTKVHGYRQTAKGFVSWPTTSKGCWP
jgi:hypothetical protein